MSDDDTLREQLLRDLGDDGHLRLDPWRSMVIGARRGVQRESAGRRAGRGLTSQQVRDLLDDDIEYARASVRQLLPWTDGLAPARLGVLVGLAISPGPGWLTAFRATLAAMACGDYDGAAQHLLAADWPAEEAGRARRLALQIRLGRWI